MTPADFNDDEMLALIMLSRVMVAADGKLAVEEMREINEIGLELGVEAFSRVSKRADSEVLTVDRAMELGAAVERPEARELLSTMLHDLANADGIDETEANLLKRLQQEWAS